VVLLGNTSGTCIEKYSTFLDNSTSSTTQTSLKPKLFFHPDTVYYYYLTNGYTSDVFPFWQDPGSDDDAQSHLYAVHGRFTARCFRSSHLLRLVVMR